MTADEGTCDVCQGESGTPFVGVACIPGVPASIGWCRACLDKDTAPAWVFDADLDMAGGDLNALNDWALSRWTWVDKHYVSFRDYAKHHWTPGPSAPEDDP